MRALATLLLLVASPTFASSIADTFGAGAFGLAWGASAADVESKFPGGKWATKLGVRSYSVSDPRVILGIVRGPLPFTFVVGASGTLNAVAVEFPAGMDGWSKLVAAAVSAFGPADPIEEIPGSVGVRWPPDTGLSLVASAQTGIRGVRAVTLAVSRAGVAKPADLGFQ